MISRNELLSEVWDLSGNLQTRAVDQFIARLRKIIEPNTATPVHLLTIRDAGYRFVLCPRGDELPDDSLLADESASNREGDSTDLETCSGHDSFTDQNSPDDQSDGRGSTND